MMQQCTVLSVRLSGRLLYVVGRSVDCHVVFLDKNFAAPHCLSSPRCINGYRQHTAWGGHAITLTSHPGGGGGGGDRSNIHSGFTLQKPG